MCIIISFQRALYPHPSPPPWFNLPRYGIFTFSLCYVNIFSWTHYCRVLMTSVPCYAVSSKRNFKRKLYFVIMSMLKTEAEFFFEPLVLPCRLQSLNPERRRDSVRWKQTLIFGKIKQSLDRTWEFQKVQAPRTIGIALRTGRLYSTGNISGTYFCYRLSRSQDHSAAGRISTKNSNDTIGNRTRDLPAWSALPQPSAPPRAPVNCWCLDKLLNPHVWINFYYSCT